MASSCAKVSLGWTLGNTSWQKGWLNAGIGSPGRWLSHRPWMCLRAIWMWCSEVWFSRGFVRVRVLWLGCGWTWWSLMSFPTWAILWFYDSVILFVLFSSFWNQINIFKKIYPEIYCINMVLSVFWKHVMIPYLSIFYICVLKWQKLIWSFI